MKKSLYNFILIISTVVLFMQCTYRSKAIVEPKFGTYNFTTYTVDTFRFRVILNGEVLTDSLLAPQGNFSRIINFLDSSASLLIINAKNNQVILDSVFRLKTGTTIISLVQFTRGLTPFIPSPPNEPAPAAGNYKIRFQYTEFPGDGTTSSKPFFYDSVMCIIRKNGIEMDTVVLRQNELTSFYEVEGDGASSFSIRVEDPLTGNLVDATTSPTIGSNFTGFNTVSVCGRSVTDDWRLIRIY